MKTVSGIRGDFRSRSGRSGRQWFISAILVLVCVSLSCKKSDTAAGPEEITEPPVINDVWVSSLSNSATVYYSTDQPAKAQVEYGILSAFGAEIETIPDTVALPDTCCDTTAFIKQHEVDLSNLVQLTEYVFRIRAWTTSSLDTVTHLSTFSTPDTFSTDTSCVGLVISNLEVGDVTDVSARVAWNTDIESDSRAAWGLAEESLDSSAVDPTLTTQHSIQMIGLEQNTVYYVRVSSTAPGGEHCTSEVITFTTADVSSPPIITNFQVLETTLTSAILTWDTNREADSRIFWSLEEANFNDSLVSTEEYVLSHQMEITGLEQYTTYYSKAAAMDQSGLRGESDTLSFFTSPTGDTLIIYNVTVDSVTRSTADISWNTNSDADTRIFYSLVRDNLSSVLTVPDLVTEHQVQLEELEKDTVYYFTVTAEDAEGNDADYDTLEFRTTPGLQFFAPDTTVGLGITVLFPIIIQWAQDLAGVEIIINFDRNVVIPADDGPVTPGPFTTENNHRFFMPSVDLLAETVTIPVTWNPEFIGDIPIGTEADGDGIVAYISFDAIAIGESNIEFDETSTRAFDVNSDLIEFEVTNGRIVVE